MVVQTGSPHWEMLLQDAKFLWVIRGKDQMTVGKEVEEGLEGDHNLGVSTMLPRDLESQY